MRNHTRGHAREGAIPRPRHRVAGANARVLLAAIIGLTSATCSSPDPARRVLEEATLAIRDLRNGTYAYDYRGTGSVAGEFTGTAAFEKSDDGFFFKATLSPSPTPIADGATLPPDSVPELAIASNGRDVAARDEATGRFSHGTYAGGSGHLATHAGYAVLFELSEEDPFAPELSGPVSLVGRETVEGVECDVVTATDPVFGEAEVTWYIGVEDRLPRARRWRSTGEIAGDFFFRMSGLEVNAELDVEALGLASLPGDAIVDEDARRVGPGDPAPAWTLLRPGGDPVSLEELRGDVVVLDFRASWCGPCRAFGGEIDRVARALSAEPVRFFAVSTWESPDVSANEHARALGLSYPVLLDGGSIAADYKVGTLPALFVIGPDGTLAYARHPLAGDPATVGRELEEAIRTVLP